VTSFGKFHLDTSDFSKLTAHARQLERDLAAANARAEKAEKDCERLMKAGAAIAELIAPGPIPAEQPTERDFVLADWNDAYDSAARTPAPFARPDHSEISR
jgi:hypothetical protein